jgi:hypothetical protein
MPRQVDPWAPPATPPKTPSHLRQRAPTNPEPPRNPFVKLHVPPTVAAVTNRPVVESPSSDSPTFGSIAEAIAVTAANHVMPVLGDLIAPGNVVGLLQDATIPVAPTDTPWSYVDYYYPTFNTRGRFINLGVKSWAYVYCYESTSGTSGTHFNGAVAQVFQLGAQVLSVDDDNFVHVVRSSPVYTFDPSVFGVFFEYSILANGVVFFSQEDHALNSVVFDWWTPNALFSSFSDDSISVSNSSGSLLALQGFDGPLELNSPMPLMQYTSSSDNGSGSPTTEMGTVNLSSGERTTQTPPADYNGVVLIMVPGGGSLFSTNTPGTDPQESTGENYFFYRNGVFTPITASCSNGDLSSLPGYHDQADVRLSHPLTQTAGYVEQQSLPGNGLVGYTFTLVGLDDPSSLAPAGTLVYHPELLLEAPTPNWYNSNQSGYLLGPLSAGPDSFEQTVFASLSFGQFVPGGTGPPVAPQVNGSYLVTIFDSESPYGVAALEYPPFAVWLEPTNDGPTPADLVTNGEDNEWFGSFGQPNVSGRGVITSTIGAVDAEGNWIFADWGLSNGLGELGVYQLGVSYAYTTYSDVLEQGLLVSTPNTGQTLLGYWAGGLKYSGSGTSLPARNATAGVATTTRVKQPSKKLHTSTPTSSASTTRASDPFLALS